MVALSGDSLGVLGKMEDFLEEVSPDDYDSTEDY